MTIPNTLARFLRSWRPMKIHPVHVQIGSLKSAYAAGSVSPGAGPARASAPALPEAVSVSLTTNLHGLIEKAVQLHQSMVLQNPGAEAKAMVQAGAGLTDDQVDALTVALLHELV